MWLHEEIEDGYRERWRLEPGWLVHEDGSTTRLPTMVYTGGDVISDNPSELDKCGIPSNWETMSI